MFIATREPVSQGQKLKVALYLETESPELVEFNGRVAWVNEEGKRVHAELPTGFGVEFLELEERAAAGLKSYLEVAGGAAGA